MGGGTSGVWSFSWANVVRIQCSVFHYPCQPSVTEYFCIPVNLSLHVPSHDVVVRLTSIIGLGRCILRPCAKLTTDHHFRVSGRSAIEIKKFSLCSDSRHESCILPIRAPEQLRSHLARMTAVLEHQPDGHCALLSNSRGRHISNIIRDP